MKNFSLGCVIIALSTLTGFSQDVRKVAFRTLCLEQIKGLESVVIPGKDPASSQKIELYTDVSPVVEGSFAKGVAAFYIEKPPAADGKQVLELVGKATLGKSDRQIFVFIPTSDAAGKLTYSVRAFDDDTKSFAMGNVRVINIAPVPVRFQLSGQTTPQIPPGKYAQFPHSKIVNDYNMYPVVIEFLSANGEWVKGQSVSWKATDRRRDIVITSVDPRFKQPSVRTYVDFPPWMEKPATDPAR